MDLISVMALVGAPLAIVFTSFCTLVYVQIFYSGGHKSLKPRHLYEDLDGISTLISVKSYSDTLPRILANVSTIIGLLIAFISALGLASSSLANEVALLLAWIRFGAWVCPFHIIIIYAYQVQRISL
jgi:hypothetical protein